MLKMLTQVSFPDTGAKLKSTRVKVYWIPSMFVDSIQYVCLCVRVRDLDGTTHEP